MLANGDAAVFFQQKMNGSLLWHEQLSVGNETMDLEHRGLLQLVASLTQAIYERNQAQIVLIFTLLEKWLHSHFYHEQKIAQRANVFSIERYYAQQRLLRDMQYLKAELLTKEGMWSDSAVEHYADYLKRWMVDEHILKHDMPIRSSLMSYPYDLAPV